MGFSLGTYFCAFNLFKIIIWKGKQKTPDEKYDDLNPPGSNTGILYGLKKNTQTS